MVIQKVLCRHCKSDKLIRAGFQSGHQRVRCFFKIWSSTRCYHR